MPTGRPSKITLEVDYRDPISDEVTRRPITEAICSLLSLGVAPSNAAAAYGIHPTTAESWKDKGRDALALAREHAPDGTPPEAIGPDDVPDEARAYVQFLEDAARAEAEGMLWHEVNVRRSAENGREHGGRLSLAFLERRQRAQYAREDRVKHGGKLSVNLEADLDEAIEGIMGEIRSSSSA